MCWTPEHPTSISCSPKNTGLESYIWVLKLRHRDRSESYTRIIDGQVRCITPDFKPKDLQVAWNVQFITVFVPAWMIPPIYHSLRRESIKNTNSASAIGVKSVRPTWFEDIVTSREPAQPEPMHGLKLVIKEKALPLKEQPEFPALAELAKRGLLAPDAWSCKRAQISLKATIDVPMLGTIIEQNGDGLLEQSHMPVGWPLHIDGAVRQSCAHRDTTLQELDNLLGEYDLKRDLVEINRRAPQWSHNTVWNKRYMEPRPGFALPQLWANSESAITLKISPSYEVKDNDIRRAVMALTAVPAATLPESAFLSALGTVPPAVRTVPPQTGSLAQSWNRCRPENQPSSKKMEERCSLPSCLIGHSRRQKHWWKLLMPSSKRSPGSCKTKTVIAQMIRPGVNDDPPPSESAASSSGGHGRRGAVARPPAQPHAHFQYMPADNVRSSRLPLTENRNQGCSDPRHRCYWST